MPALWRIETVPGSALTIDADLKDAAQIINRWKNTVFTAADGLVFETTNTGAAEQYWDIEYINSVSFRIKSRLNGHYIHIKGGGLQLGRVNPQAATGKWMLERVDDEFVRIKNMARPDVFLHAQNETLQASAIEPNWWSAMWKIENIPAPAQVSANRNNAGQNNTAQSGDNITRGKLPARPKLRSNRNQQATLNQGQANSSAPQANSPAPRNRLKLKRIKTSSLGQRVKLHIQNRSNGRLRIFTDDTQGEQVLIATLNPGEEMQENSPIGQVWRLAQNNEWLDTYKIEGSPNEQVIVFPADAN